MKHANFWLGVQKDTAQYVTHHNKTGQLSVTKKNVIFLLSERAFY